MKRSLMLFLVLSFSFLDSLMADTCTSKLSTSVSNLIPFSSSSLHCFPAWSSQGFILRYAKSGSNTWSYILSAPDSGSYISLGFSSNGNMVGSSVVAGWITSSGPGLVKQYYLGGKKSGDCPPDQGSLQLVPKMTLIVSNQQTLYLAFQLNTTDPQPYTIYAVGPNNRVPSAGGGNYLPEHRDMASAAVNYVSGAVGDAGGSSGFGSKRIHWLLTMLGWGVLMPIGVLLARYCKRWDPLWFYSHISIQGVGFVLGLAGIVVGLNLDDGGVEDVDTHKALGICILVFGCLQVIAFLIRPGKDSKVRKYWNWYHYSVGRTAIAFAIGNIFLGLKIAHEENSWSIGYGVFLAIWVVVCIVLELIRCCT